MATTSDPTGSIALAKQFGALSSAPVSSAPIDSAALAKQYGATSSAPIAPTAPVYGGFRRACRQAFHPG